MKNIISNKKGYRPKTSELSIGQLALNFADRAIYSKNEQNKVVKLGYLIDPFGYDSQGVQYYIEVQSPLINCDSSWEPIDPTQEFYLYEVQPDGSATQLTEVPNNHRLEIINGYWDSGHTINILNSGDTIPAVYYVDGTKSETYITTINFYDLNESDTVPFIQQKVNYYKDGADGDDGKDGISTWVYVSGPLNYVYKNGSWENTNNTYIYAYANDDNGNSYYERVTITLDQTNGTLSASVSVNHNDIYTYIYDNNTSAVQMKFRYYLPNPDIYESIVSTAVMEGYRGSVTLSFDLFDTSYNESTNGAYNNSITKWRPTGESTWQTASTDEDSWYEFMDKHLETSTETTYQRKGDTFRFQLYNNNDASSKPLKEISPIATENYSTFYYTKWDYNVVFYVNGSMIVDGTIYTDKIAAGAITADKIESGFMDIRTSKYDPIYDNDLADYTVVRVEDDDGSSTPLVKRLLYLDGTNSSDLDEALRITGINQNNKQGIVIDKCSYGITINEALRSINITDIENSGYGLHLDPVVDANKSYQHAVHVYARNDNSTGIYSLAGATGNEVIMAGNFNLSSSNADSKAIHAYSSDYGEALYALSANTETIYADRIGGGYALFTPDRTYSDGGYYPFTGKHIVFVDKNLEFEVGEPISIIDTKLVGSEPIKFAAKSSLKDRNIIGVYSEDQDISKVINTKQMCDVEYNETAKYSPKQQYQTLYNDLITNYKAIGINSLGDGVIKISNNNGNITSGDYLTTDGNGSSQRQTSKILKNFTVAKALESVDWSIETTNTKLIACTYHCG